MSTYWGVLPKSATDAELIEAAIERIFQTHNFFGNVSLWGMIYKALDNNQTIDEAIAAAIAEHEADEAAHLGVGESLQSHKASAIIDHEALSIVQDKFQQNLFNKISNVSFFTSLDSFLITGSVQAYCDALVIGTVAGIGNTSAARANSWNLVSEIFTANVSLEIGAQMSGSGNYTAHVGIGDINVEADGDLCEFKFVNDAIYCRNYSSVTGHATEVAVSVLSAAALHYYKIDFIAGVRCDFYIDGTLAASITDDLPNHAGFGPMYAKLINNNATNWRTLAVSPFNVNYL